MKSRRLDSRRSLVDEHAWLSNYIQSLMYIDYDEEYLSVITNVLREQLTDEMPISQNIARLFELIRVKKQAADNETWVDNTRWKVPDEKMLAFFDELQGMPQATAQYYGRYGRFFWDWMHCDQTDPDEIRPLIERLDELVDELKKNPSSKPVEANYHFSHLVVLRNRMQMALEPRSNGVRRKLPLLANAKQQYLEGIVKRPQVARKELPRIEVKPVDVQLELRTGERHPFRGVAWRINRTPIGSAIRIGFHRMFACDGKFDVFWSPASVYTMHTPGVLKELFSEPVYLTDVKWDGEHLWLASTMEAFESLI